MANHQMDYLVHSVDHNADRVVNSHCRPGASKTRKVHEPRGKEIDFGRFIAIVGSPLQPLDIVNRFVHADCSSFCLLGYPHAGKAERFGRLVVPSLLESFLSANLREPDTTPATALAGSVL